MLKAHLSHVALPVPDVEVGRRFYETIVGLVPDADLATAGVARLGLGQGDYVLELAPGEDRLRFALEIPEAAHLSRLLATLAEESVPTEEVEYAGAGVAHSFRDPDGHLVLVHGPIDRSGEGAGDPGRRPVRLHHITLTAPQPTELAAFYERLGFRISDRMGENFVWMRCNREHHTLAIVAGPAGGLDHYCYEVASWEDLKTWCDELAARGVELTWGPGRHGPGNNLFIFFDDPAGHRIEFSAEMERFWDDRAAYPGPRVWEPVRRTLNLWGVVPEMRDAVVDGAS